MAIVSRGKGERPVIVTARKPSAVKRMKAAPRRDAVVAPPASDETDGQVEAQKRADVADRLWRELVRRVREGG